MMKRMTMIGIELVEVKDVGKLWVRDGLLDACLARHVLI